MNASITNSRRRHERRHVSEHLGFMSAGPYVINTLLPVPHTPAAVAIGRERLGQMARATETAVGLENMAAGLSPADAKSQGILLSDILSPVDGFLLLDIHNVFTQAFNLRLDPLALLATFPCNRVREIYISGGRWNDICGQPYRFDSHNGPVPTEVFSLLRTCLSLCPRVEVVILERRGGTLNSDLDIEQYRADYRHLVEIVRSAEVFPGMAPVPQRVVAHDSLASAHKLAQYQDALVEVLMTKDSPEAQLARLLAHPAIEPMRDYVMSFVPPCIAATSMLARRWAKTEAQLAVEGVVPNLLI